MSPIVPFIILIIGIPTYFLLHWILKKFIIDSRTLKVSSIIGTLILAPILYFGFIFLFVSYLLYEPQYDFDKEKWFADKNTRYEMRDDLVDSGILNGKTKREIIELIGKSESADSTDIWTYNLGMSGAGLGWQFNRLELTFEDGKISDVKKIEIVD